MNYALVFAAMTILDFVWAEYTKAVAERRTIMASALSSALILLSGFVAISYVGDHEMLAPAAIGAFSGTWLSMRFGK